MNDPAPYYCTTDRIGFYIAASDQDLLAQVNRLMARSGYIGIMDTAGRLQYVLDGRRGSPYVARRILETTGRIIRDQENQTDPMQNFLGQAVDQVLAAHAIPTELKGGCYLRFLLLLTGTDETRLRPISKNLYPAAASHFRVSVSQIERDIRYALGSTELHRTGLTSTSAICRLHREMITLAERMRETGPRPEEIPPDSRSADGGHHEECREERTGR